MNMSLMELYSSMGWFAKGIVFTLLGMSAFSFTVLISKWWGMRKAQVETRKFAPEFSQFLEEDNLIEAIKLAEGYKKSHVASIRLSSSRNCENSGANLRVSTCAFRIPHHFEMSTVNEKADIPRSVNTIPLANQPIDEYSSINDMFMT